MTKSIEIYCRFRTSEHKIGVYETPCHCVEEAAGQFVMDHDCVSAFELSFEDGIAKSVRDVTEDVFAIISENIDNNVYDDCPHPKFEHDFPERKAAAVREIQDQMNHNDIERSILAL